MLLLYIDFFEKTLYNIITLKAFTELIHKRTIQKRGDFVRWKAVQWRERMNSEGGERTKKRERIQSLKVVS